MNQDIVIDFIKIAWKRDFMQRLLLLVIKLQIAQCLGIKYEGMLLYKSLFAKSL